MRRPDDPERTGRHRPPRHRPRRRAPPPHTPLGEALARLQAETPEATLLARAALSGLHARASAVMERAETPPPTTLPPAEKPLPAPLWPLLRQLLNGPAFESALHDLSAREWTLSAAQVLELYASHPTLAAGLWPLLDERGKAVLNAHPLHKAWEKAEAQAQWEARLDALREAREADAGAGAAQTLELWKETDADGRRDLLDMLKQDILLEDLPLLQHAEKDRSAEVRRRARMLQGHLPGPLQDELLALLPQAVQVQQNKISFKPFDLPEALGKVKTGAYDDSDLHRLLGALPFELVRKTLGVQGPALATAAQKKNWALGQYIHQLAREYTRRLVAKRDLIRIPLNSCTVGKAPPVHPYRRIRIFSYSHPPMVRAVLGGFEAEI
ncbi:DUF5691 domain-containing protein [Deinococcus wulumuqiensis]